MSKKVSRKTIESLRHTGERRRNIPTAELQSVVSEDQSPVQVAYARRNRDLDPQLVWRGKDERDWSDLVVPAPPLYIQEKVHPKALVDDLRRLSQASEPQAQKEQLDLFSDFNGIPEGADRTEFYQHDQNWSNRLILGDSLQVMASLAEREGLRGKVQCIYIDPPYGIKFNSNFQWSTTSRDVKDGQADHITREPEQVRAFRDTWRDGIHSYLTYLRDRLVVARDLLTESGSVFVQIGEENVHRVRLVMDEVFGDDSFVSQIAVFKTTTPRLLLDNNLYYILWYSRNGDKARYNQLFADKDLVEWTRDTQGGSWGVQIGDHYRALEPNEKEDPRILPRGSRVYQLTDLFSAGEAKESVAFEFQGTSFQARAKTHWKTRPDGLRRLGMAGRIESRGGRPWFRKFHADFPVSRFTNVWSDTSGKATERVYVVQTQEKVIARCLLMASQPGDLVLDPTCGAGTTATLAEQWGRRWITIDTSRVALALARARIMGARYPFYVLADSRDGQIKEAEVTGAAPGSHPVHGNIRHGFVYERVPHIMLSSIARNSEIDVIWEQWEATLEPLLRELNAALGESWAEWEVPREADPSWPNSAHLLHVDWWRSRASRQEELDKSIASKAEFEYLYDQPFQDARVVRVAGPFTVESLSPHRVLGVDENDELIDLVREDVGDYGAEYSFTEMILENLKTSGVQQAHVDDRINFSSLVPWPGDLICAEGRYLEGQDERRAAILVGPEYGTVQRADLVSAAREAGDSGFDALIACAFNYEAHATEFNKLGRIPILKARINADLHMADDLKNTGKGNLFVIFGEPDITLVEEAAGLVRVRVNGVDVFKPQTGEVVSDNAEGIACWFVDTDYNEESFFVRHAYFLGANDPYTALKASLKADINAEAWASLSTATSRPFRRPTSGRIAVKVINHLGDEVMKVFKV